MRYPEDSNLFIAQAAVYAAEIASPEDMDVIYGHLGCNALGALEDFLAGQRHGSFQEWAATMDTATEAVVAANAASLRAFARFEDRVRRLRGEVGDGADARQHPCYLGSGFTSDAFRLGDRYAVRLAPYGTRQAHRPEQINMYAASLLPTKADPDTELLWAHSFWPDATVSELERGKPAYRMNERDIAGVALPQLHRALAAVNKLDERGLTLNAKPSTLKFTPTKGFRFLHPSGIRDVPGQEPNVTRFARLLTHGSPATHRPLLLRLARIVRRRYHHDPAVRNSFGELIAGY